MGFNDDLFVHRIDIWQIQHDDDYERQTRPYDEEPLRASAVAPTQEAKLDTTQVLFARVREEPVNKQMFSAVFMALSRPHAL